MAPGFTIRVTAAEPAAIVRSVARELRARLVQRRCEVSLTEDDDGCVLVAGAGAVRLGLDVGSPKHGERVSDIADRMLAELEMRGLIQRRSRDDRAHERLLLDRLHDLGYL